MKRSNKNQQETYKSIKILGEGASGQAMLVRSNFPNRNYYVMKTISIENFDKNKKKKH